MLAALFNFECSLDNTLNLAIVGTVSHQLLCEDPDSRLPS